MKNLFWIGLLLACAGMLRAQSWQCGFTNSQGSPELIRAFRDLVEQAGEDALSDRLIPVQIHIIRPSNGLGAVSADLVYNLIEHQVNPAYNFNGVNYHFFRCGDPNYIDNDYLYYTQWDPNDLQYELFYNHSSGSDYRKTALNIYIANLLPGIGGFQTGMPGSDYSIVVLSTQNNSDTGIPWWLTPGAYVHEIGHYFGLLHTFAEGNQPVENVPRLGPCVNCDFAADNLCDTPADPGIGSGVLLPGCQLNPNIYQPQFCFGVSHPYQPDVNNYMSYTSTDCMSFFSQQQRNVLRGIYDSYWKNYFELTDCYCSPCYASVELPRPGADTVVVEPKIVRSKTTITSAEVILAQAPGVGYKAAGHVNLTPGFEVKPGALFRALIDDCYLPTTNKPTPGGRSTAMSPTDLEFSVWPNPFDAVLQIGFKTAPSAQARLRIANANGITVWEGEAASVQGQIERINTAALPAGVYLFSVESGGQLHVKKMVKLF
ncbi:MAG: T9SS type A sorting domain-containing protein [Saprospiraceae bacterium]